MSQSPKPSPSSKDRLIVDEATYLRFPNLDYSEELFGIIQSQRSYLGQHLSWIKGIQTLQHTQRFLKEAMLMNRGGQRLTTLIIHRGKLGGAVSLLKINQTNKYAEMGYWLQEDLQGKGIMTKCCQRLIRYAFKGLHLNRIEMRITASNQKSRNIPIRLGFLLEGRLRAQHFNTHLKAYEDVEVFGLLKKD